MSGPRRGQINPTPEPTRTERIIQSAQAWPGRHPLAAGYLLAWVTIWVSVVLLGVLDRVI